MNSANNPKYTQAQDILDTLKNADSVITSETDNFEHIAELASIGLSMVQGEAITGIRFIKQITMTDPDTLLPVELSIYKLPDSGIVGIDSSFLANTDLPVYSPYDKNVVMELD